MKKPFILVVEDEAAIAELIEIHLKHTGFECAIARDGQQAQCAVFERMPDLVLLDWMLPGLSGFSLAKQWRAARETRAMPIIMLTARADEADKVAGLEAGVDDYITKPFSTQELLARVRAVLRRGGAGARELDSAGNEAGVLTFGHFTLDARAHRVTVDGREIKLAPTEFKLLMVLMEQGDKVLGRDTLQRMVWGRYSEIEPRTVDVHIKRLREAIHGVCSQAAAQLETIRGVGYRLSRIEF